MQRNAVSDEKQSSATRDVLIAWAVLVAGLSALYLPTFSDLFGGIWATDQNAHGPIVLVVSFWFLIFKAREVGLPEFPDTIRGSGAGWSLLVIGLVLYVLGRSQSVYLFEVGSLILVLAGSVGLLFGLSFLKRLWFAFFFMVFMIPMPGSLVDTLTQPMKLAVSWGAEHVLYALDYPIARNGVVLSIGPYQLLVADACAGLNSLFTLEALGLLYMNVMRHESVLRNALLAALIVPISFSSNLVRVVTLSLITYHFGDDAGQGFLHTFSGMVLFITALLLIIGLDSLLRTVARIRQRRIGASS
ncbi:exosortase B [Niveibacterium microcysteis]|uniref:Exosortase B n=1 Tax=Niveibacterium microcysteis TaxID=2811415 RepID=A0ABX7MDT2_9RHOO|nr:exosortase B [Niveibacterium microcysteis]QSI79024.1 exosortase B [Niveibacterium microcysteis]